MGDKMKKFIPETFGGYPDNVWSRLIDPLRRLIRWDRAWRHIIDPLPSLVRKVKPEKIMEIGVHRGDSAGLLIRAAKKAGIRKVEYYGFDLFETFSLEGIKEILEKTGENIKLFKGDSRKTLPLAIGKLPKMDLIFIDGGHSYEVVKPDWENVQKLMHKNTVVIFDDYEREKGVTRTVNEINREVYDVITPIGRLSIPSSYIGRCVVKLR